MDGPPRLFSLSSLCLGCPLRNPCGAMMTDQACLDTWSAEMPGGAAVSHLTKPGTLEELAQLGGPGFDDIVARPVPVLRLGPYTPQPRFRKSFRGYLKEDTYILRAAEVVMASRVKTAAEVREALGLRADQRLIVLPFDDDAVIEEMWSREERLIVELAEAGYEAIVAPSFSTYLPRPRTEYLINMRRSMIYFGALQSVGITAVPRLAWNVSHDSRRCARWAVENPSVRMVALDLATHRVQADWRGQIEGLEIFDSMTGRTMTYLINGATTVDRCQDLLRIAEGRIRITNATTQARIAPPRLRSTAVRPARPSPLGSRSGAGSSTPASGAPRLSRRRRPDPPSTRPSAGNLLASNRLPNSQALLAGSAVIGGISPHIPSHRRFRAPNQTCEVPAKLHVLASISISRAQFTRERSLVRNQPCPSRRPHESLRSASSIIDPAGQRMVR
jgi:Domain of unknown function (DUF4417)